jgi:hypothetical protein
LEQALVNMGYAFLPKLRVDGRTGFASRESRSLPAGIGCPSFAWSWPEYLIFDPDMIPFLPQDKMPTRHGNNGQKG